MFKRVISFFEYVKWLSAKNEELLKLKGSVFRIIKNEQNKYGQHVLHIQVINKTTVFQCTASEIAAEPNLLECFSKNDIKIIIYLATEEMLRPKSQIISYGFSEKIKKAIFKIRKKNNGEVKEYPIDAVTGNKDLIKDMSQEDAHKLGYMLAMEQLKQEKEFFEKMNVNKWN